MRQILFILLACMLPLGLSAFSQTTSPFLTITPNHIDIKEGSTFQLEALGHYDGRTKQNLTTKVTWRVDNNATAVIDTKGILKALHEGITVVRASFNGMKANSTLVVYKEMYGHRLPPEPNPQINNATLLGIDSNNNGVRDDVERWIYTRYDTYTPCKFVDIEIPIPKTNKTVRALKKVCEDKAKPYHQIVREIAMQGARAAQIIIQEPEKAFETEKYMDAAVSCYSYFSMFADIKNEPILFNFEIEDDHIIGKAFDNIQFNTAMRVRAYAEYNMALSGGVFDGHAIDEMKQKCDFNVSALLKETP